MYDTNPKVKAAFLHYLKTGDHPFFDHPFFLPNEVRLLMAPGILSYLACPIHDWESSPKKEKGQPTRNKG